MVDKDVLQGLLVVLEIIWMFWVSYEILRLRFKEVKEDGK